ncbi:hypothetical protein RDI58_002594 [Solanum bulbocastanum]|uniref:Uncharacterized protein n=1 Tax=Solanum bulbocastanum TaxID=147425 RepID=A0AAN8YR22_SOLBU
MAYWNTTSNEVLAFDVKNEVSAVLHVPIPPGRYGALTQIEDELCHVTAYNEGGDVFVLDIYGGMYMSLNTFIPCFNNADDIVVIYTNERIYLYHLREQKVEALRTPGQLNPQRRFIYLI